MSEQFSDDYASLAGNGKPTQEACVRMRDYLKRHNRDFSIRPIVVELKACGWDASISTVQRRLADVDGGNPAPEHGSNTGEVSKRKKDRKERKQQKSETALKIVEEMLENPVAVAKMSEVLVDDNTSTMLAIRENRSRMAVNIIIAEMMAAKPELLLLDMRGTAALVDALTSGTKLSGGHAIDISIPTAADRKNEASGLSPNGHAMRDITPQPKSGLASELEAFRARKRAEDAKRA